MKVLVACEYSGTVRDAFSARGHDAMSCDILPTDKPGNHFQGDVRDVLDYPWDLMIAHPPCTHLSVSGARHFPEKRKDGRQQCAVSFFMMLARSSIPRIAIENPICIISSLWRKPEQIIHPWQFGHGETKATCLWLKNLPKLKPTEIVAGREQRIFNMPPSADRWKLRSITYQGIADAMAEQWGNFILTSEMNE
jgi:site-specific DNA-cytosine methylase